MSLHDQVIRVAEAVERAWFHSSRPADDLSVPLSVVAMLAMIRVKPNQQEVPKRFLPSLNDDQFHVWMTHAWREFCFARPDLIPVASRLAEWLFERAPRPDEITHARRVMVKAIEAGIFDITMSEDRYQTDLLGHVMQVLRDHGARKHHQVFTPPELASAIGMLVGGDQGAYFEPAAGTGVMFMGAARAMRERGEDPALSSWTACEIDPVAAALLAVNVVVWDLGTKVLVGCDDGLDPEWEQRARTERDGTVDYILRHQREQQWRAAFRMLADLTEGGEQDE